MKCVRCGADTAVIDSRQTEDGFMRRRRACTAGHRFTTWESARKPDTRDRSAYFRAHYAAKTPQAKKRAAIRRQARVEAARTGEPVAAIYARWDVG